MTALAANTSGIEPDYAQAFELGKDGKGVFGALELQWTGAGLVANLVAGSTLGTMIATAMASMMIA